MILGMFLGWNILISSMFVITFFLALLLKKYDKSIVQNLPECVIDKAKKLVADMGDNGKMLSEFIEEACKTASPSKQEIRQLKMHMEMCKAFLKLDDVVTTTEKQIESLKKTVATRKKERDDISKLLLQA
jgi:hypothetical protein